jgi:hypothetical protein
MSTLSDFVIADREEGNVIGESFQPEEKWPTLSGWKGIEPIKLSTLYCCITGENYTNDLQASFSLVGGNQEEGPWVFLFPNKVQSALANINTDNINIIAEKWSKTEELEMDRWSQQEAAEFIQQLNKYANKANEENKSLFLWFSL